ncbi:hypothetical protein N0V90_005682 [Kalmusia sp. IMI 367209]|nr:hypothetical protein N0V90_005682 [Kalmusia sp. IMI 367209]
MRLLRHAGGDEFAFDEYFSSHDEIPPYAILSHTWKDGEEVTFDEFTNGIGKSKIGYKKIEFCAQQAERDGLRYFWVDTCCIDKSDPIELRKSLNSMFHWYQHAAKCYVYLSDVSTLKRKASDETWEPAFRTSRWFTRGWTLQELLAPASVEFFSQEWIKLGDKGSLNLQIQRITGVPESVLQGTASLFHFSVNERLSWKENRRTKLEEDEAYSLLGIFGVHIAPIYGEGVREAFRRLLHEVDKLEKCIQNLHLTDPSDDKKRIEETKGGLFKDSYHWVLETPDFQQWRNESRLLWVKGDPGKGKTMLLCGLVNELETSLTRTDLLSYFFCQSTDSRLNNATAVLRGLMYMLVIQQPLMVLHIQRKHDYAGKAIFEGSNAWVALSEMFTNMLEDPNLPRTYLLIDALDECTVDLPKLLEFIVQMSSSASSHVKWIVSSRSLPSIEEQLARAGVTLNLELNMQSISTAVNSYIQQKVVQLANRRRYDDKTRNAVLNYLFSNAQDTFLWVALVCQALEGVSKRNVKAKLETFPPGLDALYERMMKQIRSLDDADLCKQILALTATVYQPITVQELVTLVEQLEDEADDPDSITEIIGYCGSFLTLRNNTIYFVHQSAKEFVCTKALHEIFPSGRQYAHGVLLSRSLHVMSSAALHRDMYHLRKLGYPIEEVKQPDPDPLAPLRYSCIYWIDHLSDCNLESDAKQYLGKGAIIDVFLSTKYLYWLEALSLCKSISKGVRSMAKLASLVQERTDAFGPNKLIYDAHRFIMYHKVSIENHPLQTYASGLLFSPTRSLIRQLFKAEAPAWVTIMPSMQDEWSSCLQTLEGHNDYVFTVVFSYDSNQLASASYHEIKIWDAVSGQCLHTLGAHDRINSIAFSHDSKKLATVLEDGTVHVWNVIDGKCLLTLQWPEKFYIPEGSRGSVKFSHDSSQLLSTCFSELALWDVGSSKYLQIFEGHDDFISSVSFSYDSKQIASASKDSRFLARLNTADLVLVLWDNLMGLE